MRRFEAFDTDQANSRQGRISTGQNLDSMCFREKWSYTPIFQYAKNFKKHYDYRNDIQKA